MRESAVAGTLLTYAATAANYGLAVAYVVLLTRFVPLEDYGHYNALVAAAGLLGLFFPTLGVDDAIAREGAAAAARGQAADRHAAAIALIALALNSAYAAAVAATLPRSAPPHLAPVAYLLAAGALLNGLATALGVQLWMEGRLATRGRGLLLQSVAFRVSQTVLIVVLRSVYAIALATLVGAAAQLAYYVSRARVPNPFLGLSLLRVGLRRYLSVGMQNWVLNYAVAYYTNGVVYLGYLLLGPGPVALYGLASQLLAVVSSLPSAASQNFASRASQAVGLGVRPAVLVPDFLLALAPATSALAQAAALAAPLVVLLGIVHGGYVEAVPLFILLAASAVPLAAFGLYAMAYWAEGRGWLALALSAPGMAAALGAVALWRGLYGLAAATYLFPALASAALMAATPHPGRGRSAVLLAAYTALALAASLSPWPVGQVASLAATAVVSLAVRPVPQAAVDQLPPRLKPFLQPFAR